MSTISPLAVELNETIAAANPHVMHMLSARGRAIFFPSKGILAQSAEAKGKKINATIGIALEDDGTPLVLPCLSERLKLPAADAFTYAPSDGLPGLRDTWREMIYAKNSALKGVEIGRPVVTAALTHGLSVMGYLFGDAGDVLTLPDLDWDNYRLIFTEAYGVQFQYFPTFVGKDFNVEGMKEALLRGPVGKRIVLLNFPNNPCGYTATEAEAKAIALALTEVAVAGNDVVVLIDDAYFGLVYEDGVFKESLFSLLANAHERLLAVKLDAATKEDYVWGFRVGFITYGIKGGTTKLYRALEAKTAGMVRGNISNAPHLSQSLLRAAYTSPDYGAQKQAKYATLKRRYDKVKAILAAHPEYAKAFAPLPFNSGYFMCVRLHGAEPEVVRQVLLKDYSTGVIALAGVLRLAFSATPINLLEELFANVYKAVLQVQAAK